MEEERVVSLLFKETKLTAEILFKSLYFVAEKAINSTGKLMDIRFKTPFKGESEWNKFMNSVDSITIKDLKTVELNLDEFKEQLKKYGIGFSFYKHFDGETVSLAYAFKHKDIVEKALSDTLEKIVNKKNVRETIENSKKKTKVRDLEEKLKYYKNVEEAIKKEKGLGVKEKVPTKGEKVL